MSYAEEEYIDVDEAPGPEPAKALALPAMDPPPPSQQAEHLNMLWKLARLTANTEMVPRALRGRPDAALAVMVYGHEMGLQPMTSLREVYIIDGTPSCSAKLMRALIYRAGHRLEFRELTRDRVVIWGERADGKGAATVTWDLDEARAANLLGKDNWKKYPRQMLTARATSELARLIFPEVGIGYTPEELAGPRSLENDYDYVDIEMDDPRLAAELAESAIPEQPAPPRDAGPAPEALPAEGAEVAAPPAAEPEGPEPEFVPDERPHDDGLARRIHSEIAAVFPGATQLERDRIRHALCMVVTRKREAGPVKSSNDLDLAEQLALSELLARIEAGQAHASIDRAGPVVLQTGGGWRYTVTIDPPSVAVTQGEQLTLDTEGG